ncbi:putative F-box protein [Cinnamomum micranthum f. kanehirae]|uniref:Putative F-box protein n=1 Tax=Cinnamomum micranthum f. kanehirae TaxID=337451 RepID=A0A443NP10_9MAGN|nr:putative F-box protein [Cinnamomum micranthum f. kanehirae]
MAKSRRRESSISSCTSPRSVFLSPHSIFNWYERDIWTEIAKFLDGKCLVKLGLVNRWFHRLVMEESVWKFACLRDLHVPPPAQVAFNWIQLYASAFDGSHSYSYHQPEKHIDWMRIGAFFLDSPVAMVTDRLSLPRKLPQEESTKEMIQKSGICMVKNVKMGIWIADLQLVRCPVCNLETCEGTMQTLDARHLELFLHEEYKNGTWEYKEIGSRHIKKQCTAASGGIFDVKYLHSPTLSEVFNLKLWTGKQTDWQPKARITIHGVGINTNLQPNEGLHVKYHAMRSGADGEAVSMRISQQLI